MNDLYMNKLKYFLIMDFKNNVKSGVYFYTQISMSYNSNKMEGSTFSKQQTRYLFDTGYVEVDDGNVIKAKDVEEMQGHFLMFNQMLKTFDNKLDEDYIKELHKCLKQGVFEDKANGYVVGDYKDRNNQVGELITSKVENVSDDMINLLNSYNNIENKSLKDVVEFHVRFEQIHPFQDGNGRVGRMILFKECLANDLVPVVIKNKNKLEYLKGLEKAQLKDDFSDLLELCKKEQKDYYEDTKDLVLTDKDLTLVRLNEFNNKHDVNESFENDVNLKDKEESEY